MATKKRLGELLIEAGAIDEAMLQSALGHQRRWGGRIGQALLDLKLLSETAIVEALARKHGFEVARLASLEPGALEAGLKLVSRDFAARHLIFPVAADRHTLTVAMADPTNLAVSDELRFRSNRRVKICIAGDREISEAIRTHYPTTDAQQVEAISLDNEVTSEFMPPLAEPFGGGSTEAMEKQMHRPGRPGPVRPAPAAEPIKEARAEQPASVPRGGSTSRDSPEDKRLTPLPLRSTPVGSPARVPVPQAAPGTTRPPLAQVPAATPVPGRLPAHPAPVPEVVLEEEEVEGRIPLRPLSPKEVVVLDALDRLAAGQDDVPLPVKPSQVAAALLRIMLRQKIVTQQELLDELLRK